MSSPLAPATYSDYVFDRLRGDIVSGAVEPSAKLAIRDLCVRYKVGMSPVREALHRLAGEGIVHLRGQRGFTAPPISADDLEDLTELRLVVEETALRKSIAHGDDTWEAGIVAAFHRLERQIGRFADMTDAAIRAYDVVHRDFHVALYAGAASPRLAALHASLFDQAFRYRKVLHEEAIPPRAVLAEHRSLMKVVLSRDAKAAIAAVHRHLELTRTAARKHFKSMASRK
ncbi:MAG: GntR family transcriptional regulator [Betaproteobacteria bacterium]